MSENNQKTDADYEEAYLRFLEAQKAKKSGKFPVWIVVVIGLAVLLILGVVVIKPWSLFDNGGESENIYETEEYEGQRESDDAMNGSAQDGYTEVQESSNAAETAEETAAQETSTEEAPMQEIPVPEETGAEETHAQETAAAQENQTVKETSPQTAETTADELAGITLTGSVVQDNGGLFTEDEIREITAITESGELAFSGTDFFVVVNKGSEGKSNSQLASEYYQKLVRSGRACGNGILIFINTEDMTANIITSGTANSRIGSAGNSQLTEEFVNTYRGTGSFADAVRSTYYAAEDLIISSIEGENE